MDYFKNWSVQESVFARPAFVVLTHLYNGALYSEKKSGVRNIEDRTAVEYNITRKFLEFKIEMVSVRDDQLVLFTSAAN